MSMSDAGVVVTWPMGRCFSSVTRVGAFSPLINPWTTSKYSACKQFFLPLQLGKKNKKSHFTLFLCRENLPTKNFGILEFIVYFLVLLYLWFLCVHIIIDFVFSGMTYLFVWNSKFTFCSVNYNTQFKISSLKADWSF